MEARRRIPSALRVAAVGLVVLLVVLVLYVLTIGPATNLVVHGRMDQETYDTAYAPILWAYKRSMTLKRLVNWYCLLWI